MKSLLTTVLAVLILALPGASLAHDDIVFLSQPVFTGQVGQAYEYQVVAVSAENPGEQFSYAFEDNPEGMTINSSTGLVEWTPTTVGSFRVKIRAEAMSDGDHEDQEYTLRILNGPPATVQGNVHNEPGEGVANVRIRLFEISSGHFVFTTRTDSAGNYLFHGVDPGEYFLRALPPENSIYARQWFDRARRIEEATPIQVAESSTVTIDVALLLRRPADRFRLSGAVRDTSGGPVAGARVFIFHAREHDDFDSSGFNFRGLDDDERRRELEEVAVTDTFGNYQALLRSRTFILLAFKRGFEPQFWDHQSNVLEADRLRLVSDTSGIDFDLREDIGGNGSISGRISERGTGEAVTAHVLGLHRESPNGDFTGFVRHAQTDTGGNYVLPSLLGGFYVVLALPHGDFLPTFYNTSGGTTRLEEAFPVEVAGTAVENIDVAVAPDTVEGLSRIRGTVSSIGVPLSGSLVYAVSDRGGSPRWAAISESNGNYSIVGVTPGSYHIVAMKPGFVSAASPSFVVQYDSGMPSTTLANVILGSSATSVGNVSGVHPSVFVLHQNYPNPFNPTTEIRFDLLERGIVRLAVFDILGRLIRVLADDEFAPGNYQVQWDGKNDGGQSVSTGTYVYRLKVGTTVVAQKMVLLK